MRVFICRRTEALIDEARQILYRNGDHRMIGCCMPNQISIGTLRTFHPDAFVLDCAMPLWDGLSLARYLAPTPCLLLAPGGLAQPLPDNVICIRSLAQLEDALERLAEQVLPVSVRKLIVQELICLGFRPQTRGFAQLYQALTIILRREKALEDLRGQVYNPIAKCRNCTPASVERNLRYAIECAWVRGDLAALQERFGYTIDQERGKPTNRAFLAQMAEHIRLHSA